MGKLAKLEDLMQRVSWSGDQHDDLVVRLLEVATATAEQLVGRELTRKLEITEFPTPAVENSQWLRLERAPIENVESVTVLHHVGTDADHDEAAALVENVGFVVHGNMAKLQRIDGRIWPTITRSIRVLYDAGFIDPAIEDPPESAIQPPTDLQDGIVQHAIRLFQTRDTAGLREISVGDAGSYSLAEAKPHPALLAACQPLRRLSV